MIAKYGIIIIDYFMLKAKGEAMKKTLAVFLLIAMLFALVSCTITPATTDTNSNDNIENKPNDDNTGNDNTQTPGDDNTQTPGGDNEGNEGGTSGGDTYVPPILDYDANKYEAKYADTKKTKIKYGTYSVKVPFITDYYNNYEAALSMTFDDGADVAAAALASEIMSQYGLKGTLMVNTGNIQGNLSKWQEVVAQGSLDIGSHGWSHKDPNTISEDEMEHEIKDSYDFLQEHFAEYNPVTYATPLSHLTDAYKQYLKDTGFISNRLETFGTMVSPDSENPDMYTLYSKRIDTGNNIETNVRINVGDALNAGKWFIELYHNVRTQDGTDVPEEDFRNHCKWLYDNYNGKVWFASYDDVSKYFVQKQTATIEYVACDIESMTFIGKVEKNYGQEMTLKFYMPFFIDSAYAIIDGETQLLTIEKEPNTRVAYINTVLSEEGTEIKIVMGGNDKYQNNCQHAYEVKEVIAPTKDAYGYTEMICTKCSHTYKELYTEYSDESNASTVSFGGETLSLPSLTNYYHNYRAAISFTVDDGYDGNTATNVADVLKEYNMRCTAMLNPSAIINKETTIKQWQDAAAGGCL